MAEPASGLNLLHALCVCRQIVAAGPCPQGIQAGLSLHRVISLEAAWLSPCLAEAGRARLLRPGAAGENLGLGDIKASGPL